MSAGIESLAYRVLWERAQSIPMCQVALVVARLGANEFAGFCAGYVGSGEFIREPFHVIFRGEQPVHLAIADRQVLDGRPAPFERWPQPVRMAVVRARQRLLTIVQEDEEGALIAAPNEATRIRWHQAVADEGVSEAGRLDERVWLRIPAQLGLAGGLELDEFAKG